LKKNSYEIFSTSNKSLGVIEEKTKASKTFLGHLRGFHFQVFDESSRVILKFQRPFSLFSLASVEVFGDKNHPLGFIKHPFSLLSKKYILYDNLNSRKPFGSIRSPLWKLWSFPVLNSRKQQIALIEKKWSGTSELISNADRFKIEIPDKLSFEKKAVILATCIMIDFNYFEKKA